MNTICIAGGGIMGSAIAQVFAQAGWDVTVYDISEVCLGRLKDTVRTNQRIFVENGRITEAEAEAALRRISVSSDMQCFEKADLVIEAIIEKMDVKQRFFAELEAHVSPDAILATNTSGLSINGIGTLLKRKERFIGANWWTPAYIIPLVEIVRADDTSDETAATLREILERVGKKPIVVAKEVSGFVGNRMQFALFREALHIAEEGLASYEDIDRVLVYGLGLRYAVLGPFSVADYGGVDTYFHISDSLFSDLETRKDAPNNIRALYEAGKFGLKTGEGFYAYRGRDVSALQAERDRKLLEILKITV